MSDPKVIYLGPACEAKTGDGRTWAEDWPWPDCECGHQPVQYVLGETFSRMKAARDALQQDLNQRDEQIATLESQREAWLRNSQAAERLLTASVERYDLAKTLLRETVAVLRGGNCYGWEDNQADAIDKFLGEVALKPAECDHSYHHFGTEQPRRRCNLCNKLKPMSSAQVAAFNDDHDHRPECDE